MWGWGYYQSCFFIYILNIFDSCHNFNKECYIKSLTLISIFEKENIYIKKKFMNSQMIE